MQKQNPIPRASQVRFIYSTRYRTSPPIQTHHPTMNFLPTSCSALSRCLTSPCRLAWVAQSGSGPQVSCMVCVKTLGPLVCSETANHGRGELDCHAWPSCSPRMSAYRRVGYSNAAIGCLGCGVGVRSIVDQELSQGQALGKLRVVSRAVPRWIGKCPKGAISQGTETVCMVCRITFLA